MEYIALAIILYFILRTVGNLVRLLGGENEGPSRQRDRQGRPSRQHGWQGPSPRQQTGTARNEPTFWDEDIEDATWRDLEKNPRNRRNTASH